MALFHVVPGELKAGHSVLLIPQLAAWILGEIVNPVSLNKSMTIRSDGKETL